jgi:hypothetical protein
LERIFLFKEINYQDWMSLINSSSIGLTEEG